MKNSNCIITAFFIFLFVTPLSAQKESFLHREIGIRIGTSLTMSKESRFSNMTKRYIQPKFGLAYIKMTDKKREELILSYTSTFKPKNPTSLWYKIINTEVNYTYQRKVKNTWLGGTYQSSTILNFPNNGRGLFGNNPISYTIINSLGIAVDHTQGLLEKNNRRLDINLGTRIPLVSYLIRPIYGHPYPEHFLQEDVFTPTRNNIGKSIFRSGKVRTIDKYQSIKLVLGLHYYHNDHLKIGMNYEGSIQRVSDGKRLTYSYHDLILNVSYVY